MRLCAAIKFDRQINPNHRNHYISPGGYEMKFSNGETVQFDFMDYCGNVDSKDRSILYADVEVLDTDSFPESEWLRHFTGTIDEILEFYIYTGEDHEEEIFPVELLGLTLYNDDDIEIPISETALHSIWKAENYYVDSLNEIHAGKSHIKMQYYCNACGEIGLPTDVSPLTVHEAEELPIQERELYETYWSDRYGFKTYVVNYNKTPALALNFLVCEQFVEDTIGRKPTDEDMDKVFAYLGAYAGSIDRLNMLDDCEVAIGDYTDPDGHELMVIVPYNARREIPYICECLDNAVYTDIECIIKEAFSV